jgi:subtilase family serine protease
VALPSRNVTVPVAADGLTDANKVTGWPYAEGLADTDTEVDVVKSGACVIATL